MEVTKANKLKGKIVEKGTNVESLSEIVGIDKATFYRKLKNFDNFTIGETLKIKDALNLSREDASDIFLS